MWGVFSPTVNPAFVNQVGKGHAPRFRPLFQVVQILSPHLYSHLTPPHQFNRDYVTRAPSTTAFVYPTLYTFFMCNSSNMMAGQIVSVGVWYKVRGARGDIV